MINILEAASNLYQSNLDLKNFAKWPDDLVNSNLLPRIRTDGNYYAYVRDPEGNKICARYNSK